MRRLLPVLLAALVATLLVLPSTAALADVDTSSQDVLLLATEGGEPVGPEPDPENTNAPAAYEPPFLINAARGLTALMIGLVVAIAGLYYVLVYRPRQGQGS